MGTIQPQTNYDYPLVNEYGETFISDEQLARHIREKCGDEISRFIEKKLEDAKENRKWKDIIKQALYRLWEISLSEIEEPLTNAIDILEKAGRMET